MKHTLKKLQRFFFCYIEADLTWTRNTTGSVCTRSRRSVASGTAGRANIGVLKGKGSPCSITERRVPELIPVLGSQPAGDVSHKPGGRLPLLSARPAVTLATLKRAATNFAAW